MKKILQRIGLLAAAVMLLWGWQGMEAKAAEAKAAEPIFKFEYENPENEKYINGKLTVDKDDKGYFFNLCLKTGHIFIDEPVVKTWYQGFIV